MERFTITVQSTTLTVFKSNKRIQEKLNTLKKCGFLKKAAFLKQLIHMKKSLHCFIALATADRKYRKQRQLPMQRLP